MIDIHCLSLLLAALVWLPCTVANAADLFNFQATALKGPECITDPSASYFAQNAAPAEPPHPTLPIGRYYMIVRYLGADSVSVPVAQDFGHLPQSYPWPPYRGIAVTGLSVPDPKPAWQRAGRADATADNSSAFQLHCYDAGSFINTWTFPDVSVVGGGPHSIYGYSFYDDQTPLVYDGNPETDFVLQASIEIPWFAAWPDPMTPASAEPIGQVNLFAYFRDRESGKTFALLLAIFDNRFASSPAFPSFASHDEATPFVSMPITAGERYGTLSPYSSTFTGSVWNGLRFFRIHVTQPNFRQALADINAYCRTHAAKRYCGSTGSAEDAYSPVPNKYEITDFGVIHEIDRGGPRGNLSMGAHIYDLGAWNFR